MHNLHPLNDAYAKDAGELTELPSSGALSRCKTSQGRGVDGIRHQSIVKDTPDSDQAGSGAMLSFAATDEL